MSLVRTNRTVEVTDASPPSLLAAVDDADPDVRRDAVLGLRATPEAARHLLPRLGTEDDPAVRDALLRTLASWRDPVVLDALVSHLRSQDAQLRSAVVGALASMSWALPDALEPVLGDDDPDVRILAVMVLGQSTGVETAATLKRVIGRDSHPNVVGAALDAALPLLGPADADLLRQTRRRFATDPFLGFAIDLALAQVTGS